MNIWKACSERKDYEKLVYVLRADLIVLVRPVILFTVLFFVPFFVRHIFQLVAPTILSSTIGALAFTVYRGAYLLFILVFALTGFYDYYLDVWYITNQKIIDVEQRGLFNRKISTFRLDMIQDTTIEVPGILATFIGYGDIHIQTAGRNEKFTLRGVNNPARVNQIITAEYGRAREALREVRIAG